MHQVITRVVAKPSKASLVLAVLSELTQSSREQELCISYHLYQGQLTPDIFYTIELWQSREAALNHLQSKYATCAAEALKELAFAGFEVTHLEPQKATLERAMACS